MVFFTKRLPFFTEQDGIDITYEDKLCPRCNTILTTQTRSISRQIGSDCGSCRYGGGNCQCHYVEKKFLFITCKNCNHPKCPICTTPIGNIPRDCYKLDHNMCKKCICTDCREKTKTPQERLYDYDLKLLQSLAKEKRLTGYSTLTKSKLIKRLAPIVIEEDFPIKRYCILCNLPKDFPRHYKKCSSCFLKSPNMTFSSY